MEKYDVVIIGAGPVVHGRLRIKGGEQTGRPGRRGPLGRHLPKQRLRPKKVFVSGMEAAERSNQLAGRGLVPVRSIRWPELAAFKRTFTDPFPGAFRKKIAEPRYRNDQRKRKIPKSPANRGGRENNRGERLYYRDRTASGHPRHRRKRLSENEH